MENEVSDIKELVRTTENPVMGVYIHICIPTGKQYVGKSWNKRGIYRRWSEERRASRYKKFDKYNPLLNRAIRKYGWDKFHHFILHEVSFETHGENWRQIILDLEVKEQIERNTLEPNGLNCLLGDPSSKDGVREISEEKRLRHSQASKGKNNGMYGKKHTEEAKKLMRAKTGPDHHCYGKKKPEHAIRATIEAHNVKVEQWSKDGKTYIRTFVSIKEAAESTGACASHIGQCAKGGVRGRKTCGGFVWKFAAT
jgi:group I intron endonuclease